MSIAIKEFTEKDKKNFSNFLNTPREDLPELKLAPLVPPHEDIAIVAAKQKSAVPHKLEDFSIEHKLIFQQYKENIVSLSKGNVYTSLNKCNYLFSGYVIHEERMFIGSEISQEIADIREIYGDYGEFSLATIGDGTIELSSDYFGMVPWFYFDNSKVFAASNNYHLLLLILTNLNIELSMNIKHSRVNLITTGFTYGTPFSINMDVTDCKINHAYEIIHYSFLNGIETRNTELYDILCSKTEWNEDEYESCIYKAKEEILNNCKAIFEHPQFKRIVVDVSGGFDSRIVFAAVNCLPKKLRNKIYTYTRTSNTPDDVQKASAITNIYSYPKYNYSDTDDSNLFEIDGKINLAQISRTLGSYSISSYLYTANYNNFDTLEITGGLGEVVLGYKRVRGELDYSLGDKRLLSRLGGCFWHNCVEELKPVFKDQESLIFEMLNNYNGDCLFKKFHQLYTDTRNRFIIGSAHNIENNNMRIPVLFSKNALKAKWMYFNNFHQNCVPDEKISIDLLTAINPLLTCFPFCSSNDDVIPIPEHLLNPIKVNIIPDYTVKANPESEKHKNSYKKQVLAYMSNLHTLEQMILYIYDYSEDYYPVCLAAYKLIEILRENDSELKTSHTRETIRKIYDIFFQIQIISSTNTLVRGTTPLTISSKLLKKFNILNRKSC